MTLGQMRIFLREGERVKRKSLAQQARVMRAAMWSEGDAFEDQIGPLEE